MDYVTPSQGHWYCVAGSKQYSYQIEQLDRQASQSQLAIYNSPQIDSQHLIEVIQVNLTQNSTQGILGNGITQDGRTIKVSIFQQTVDFVIEDSGYGMASGVCSYLSDWQ